MPTQTWLDYHNEYLPSGRTDAVYCGFTRSNPVIYVARVFCDGCYIPGYALDGIGYFVSKERQPFILTTNFQVLVSVFIVFVDFSTYQEKAIVADNQVELPERIKFGSFLIDDVRYCGMVDKQNTCHIYYDNKVVSKEATEFEVALDLTSPSEEMDFLFEIASSNDFDDPESPSDVSTIYSIESDIFDNIMHAVYDAENVSNSKTDNDMETDFVIVISSNDDDA
ncbi:Hypothetical predicted protein [Cloeon dipterum]|uniref:Uncharacterized protein n=1 Tax=Cloeon dipterum TaxID=197152 RepID=A0A8S1DPT0_9INSE|nr:Hypothetical predicted protein [Cloeon dipterum]